jgi:mono/diheme cytochrome c family protein
MRTAAAAAGAIDTTLIDRGRYIVKIAGCNDCHTPGYAEAGGAVEEKLWLVGGGAGWQGDWGTTFPINLRLFMQSLSAEQWLKVARSPSRPPMPWFALRDMSDADLVAIYHYVRSLGAAGTEAPAYLPPGKDSTIPVVKFPG